LAHHCKRDIETIEKDTDRDFYMTADAAKEYGVVDQVLESAAVKAAEKIEAERLAKEASEAGDEPPAEKKK
jgi:hypothetical protein